MKVIVLKKIDQLLFLYSAFDRFFKRTLYFIDFSKRPCHLIVFFRGIDKTSGGQIKIRNEVNIPQII